MRDTAIDVTKGKRQVSARVILACILSVGIGLGAGSTVRGAQPPSAKEVGLLRTDLAGVKGLELLVSRLETAPGWVHGRHHHPGHEIVYVLSGSAILEVDGKPPITLGPGTVAYIPPGQVHAGKNGSRTTASEFLLLRIHEKGQPIAVEESSRKD